MMPGPQGYHGAAIRTFAFPAVTAKFFRIELDGAGLHACRGDSRRHRLIPAAAIHVTEAIFYSDARVNRWEDKGAFGSLMDVYDVVPTPAAPAVAEISRNDVIDLTGKMDKDGTLHWEVPRRQLDDSAHGLLADRREEPAFGTGGQRLRGGQAQREVCSEILSTATWIRCSSISAT